MSSQARAPFNWEDPFQLEDQLTEEERMIRDTARNFCQDRLMSRVLEANRHERFDREIMNEFGELGLLGMTIPEDYGCAGVNYTAYGLVAREVERVDSGYRSAMSVQSSLVMHPIYAYGSEEQRLKYLPKLATGEYIGCFGLTEPDHGSDPGGMVTRAKKVDGGYLLSGAKMWITNSPIADIMIVWAKTKLHGETDASIRGFIVERGFAGVSTPETHGKLSLRASITGEIVLNDVKVPKANLLPKVKGLRGPLGCLTQARYGIGWGAIGAAMGVYEGARRYTMDRIQFGKPLAGFQLTQQKLTELHNQITKAFLMAQHFGRLKQKGDLSPIHVSMLKRDNVRMALEAARAARSMLGGNGIMGEFHIMRHVCNLETVFTYEGTHEVHTLAIGRAITGENAFT